MIKTMICMTMVMTISMLLMMMCKIISKKSKSNREKNTPFECGFDPKSSSRIPFSTQFFMIAIIFLIFDIEIIIIMPSIKMIQMSNLKSWIMTNSTFMLILILGLYYEWQNNMLEWMN